MQPMNIGEAAAAAGVTPKMMRHYETLGLIPQPGRSDAGYRLYGEREIAMLRFIRQSRSLGFSMEQIESLMSLWRDPSRQSSDVKRVALGQLSELEQRQRELDQMRSTLQDLVAQCRGDHSSHCAILESLADAPTRAPAAAGPERARRALKQVRAGEPRAPRARHAARPEAAAVPPHAALSAWARSFS
jgi:Cu(I)-responsive transcriptional regulator